MTSPSAEARPGAPALTRAAEPPGTPYFGGACSQSFFLGAGKVTTDFELRRSGSRLVATWRKAAGAATYEVMLRLGDGRSRLQMTRKRTASFPGLERDDSGTVTVVAISRDRLKGKPVRIRLRRR